MNEDRKINLSNFDFNAYKAVALNQIKSGQPLTGGVSGILILR
jgi:hypothetical protein